MLSYEFCEIFKNPFLQNTSAWLLLDFFHSLSCFYATRLTNRNQVFCIFEHVLSRLSNVMIRWPQRATILFHGFFWRVLRIWHSSWKCQTVLGSFKQSSEVSNSFWKCQTVLGNLKQFSEVLNSSRKSQTVLGRLKQFSEVLNSSQKSLKQFWEVSNSSQKSQQFSEKYQTVLGTSDSSRQSQTVLAPLNNFWFLAILFVISWFCWPLSNWYSFYWPWKDERLSRPWSHLVVLNAGPLDWKSRALTTRLSISGSHHV